MPVVSASQLERYKRCPRQWGYRYLDKLPDPQKPGSAVGECCHWYLEKHLNPSTDAKPSSETWDLAGKSPTDIEQIMAPFFRSEYLPTGEVEAEKQFKLTIDGDPEIPIIGKIDWFRTIEAGPDGKPGKAVEIGDLKTTKSWHYMKEKEFLFNDWQAKVYATAALEEPDWVWCRLRWVYVKTTRDRATGTHPDPRPIGMWISRKWAEKARQEVNEAAHILAVWYLTKKKARHLSPNIGEACRAFGGCPYHDRCRGGVTVTDPRSEIEALLNQAEKTAELQSPVEEDPTAALQRQLEELQTKIAASVAQSGSTKQVPPAPAPAVAEPEPPAPVVPEPAPVAAEPEPPPPVIPEPAEPEPPPSVIPEPVVVAETETPPKRRGRPKGAKNKPKLPVKPTPVPEPSVSASSYVTSGPVQYGEPEPPATANRTMYVTCAPVRTRTLYVNCGPVRTHVPWVSETTAFAAAAADAAKSAKSEHWALAEYGQGNAILATAMMRHLDQLPSAVRISTSTMEARAVYSVLQQWATEIVTAGG